MSNPGLIPSPGSTTIRAAKSLDGVSPTTQDPTLGLGTKIASGLVEFTAGHAKASLNSTLNKIESDELTRLQEASTRALQSFDPDEANDIMEEAEQLSQTNISRLEGIDAANIGATLGKRAALHRRDVDNHRVNLNRRRAADERISQDRLDFTIASKGQEDLTASAIEAKKTRVGRLVDSGDMEGASANQEIRDFIDRAIVEHVYGVLENQADDPTRFKRLVQFLNDDDRTGEMTQFRRSAILRVVRKAQSSKNLDMLNDLFLANDEAITGSDGDDLINGLRGINSLTPDDHRQAMNIKNRRQGQSGPTAALNRDYADVLRRRATVEKQIRGVLIPKGSRVFPTTHPLVDMGGGDVSNVLTIVQEIPRGSGDFFVLPSMVNGIVLTDEDGNDKAAVAVAVEQGLDLYPKFGSLEEAIDFSKQVHDKVGDNGEALEDVPGPIPEGNVETYLTRFVRPGDEKLLEITIQEDILRIQAEAEESHSVVPSVDELMIRIARDAGKISKRYFDQEVIAKIQLDEKPTDSTLAGLQLLMQFGQAAPQALAGLNLNASEAQIRDFGEEVKRFQFGISPVGLKLEDINFETSSGVQQTTATGVKIRMRPEVAYRRAWLNRHQDDSDGTAAGKLRLMGEIRHQLRGGVGTELALDELNNALRSNFDEDELPAGLLSAIRESGISRAVDIPGADIGVAMFAAANEWVHQRGFVLSPRINGDPQFRQWPINHPAIDMEVTFFGRDGVEQSYGYLPYQAEAILSLTQEAQFQLQDPVLQEIIEEFAANKEFTTGHRLIVNPNTGTIQRNEDPFLPDASLVGPGSLEEIVPRLEAIIQTWAARTEGMNVNEAWQKFNNIVFGIDGPAGRAWEPDFRGDRYTKFGRDAKNNPEPPSWSLLAVFADGTPDGLINFGRRGLTTRRMDFSHPDAILSPALREFVGSRKQPTLEEVQFRLDKAKREAQARKEMLEPYREAISFGVSASMLGNLADIPLRLLEANTGFLQGEVQPAIDAFSRPFTPAIPFDTRIDVPLPFTERTFELSGGRQNLNNIKVERAIDRILDKVF